MVTKMLIPTIHDVSSEAEYVENVFNKLFDVAVFINPYLSVPYFDLQSKEGGVYELTLLVHVSQPTKEIR